MNITGKQLREKFLNFFQDRDHTIIPSAPLIPSAEEQLEGKERVLFTSAGMQPLIPYLLGKKQPPSQKLADVQKCLRTDDIEEVGDATHHTFFEMLGNWSIGAYWKEEAIKLSFDFLTKELGIPIEKLAVTVFAGDEDANKDEESAKIWEEQGISKERIYYFGKEHNWWPTARYEQDSGEFKNPFGPCGPDTEMFYWTGEGEPEGKPNEEPRWVEIWNDVFMQFNRKEDETLEELPQRNVDTGMGLERTLAVLNGKDSAFETDLFEKPYELIRNVAVNFNSRSTRIIVDHIRAAVFIMSEGIEPDKVGRGSVLRGLIRRSLEEGRKLRINTNFTIVVALEIQKIYESIYPEVKDKKILETLEIEENRYKHVLNSGVPLAESLIDKVLSRYDASGGWPPFKKEVARIAFDLHQSQGLPEDYFIEMFIGKLLQKFTGLVYSGGEVEAIKKEFQKLKNEHRERSRRVKAGEFKGGLVGHSEVEIKYHTATHLLHQALRDVLGPDVFQKGSNINTERLRFDFSFDRKLTDEEIKKVEDLVNEKIKEDLQVDHKTVPLKEARNLNAIGLFDEKYGTDVSLYSVGPGYKLDPEAKDQRYRGGYYSLEFCGGPHVSHTGEIGEIRITKEEAISAGIRRIRAQLV